MCQEMNDIITVLMHGGGVYNLGNIDAVYSMSLDINSNFCCDILTLSTHLFTKDNIVNINISSDKISDTHNFHKI